YTNDNRKVTTLSFCRLRMFRRWPVLRHHGRTPPLLMLYCLLVGTASHASSGDCAASVWALGDFSARMGSGVIVGDGSYVLTCRHIVTEDLGGGKNALIPHPIVLTREYGVPVRASIAFNDKKTNLV